MIYAKADGAEITESALQIKQNKIKRKVILCSAVKLNLLSKKKKPITQNSLEIINTEF